MHCLLGEGIRVGPSSVESASDKEAADEDLVKEENPLMRMMIILVALRRLNILLRMLINDLSWGGGVLSQHLLGGVMMWMDKSTVWPSSWTQQGFFMLQPRYGPWSGISWYTNLTHRQTFISCGILWGVLLISIFNQRVELRNDRV